MTKDLYGKEALLEELTRAVHFLWQSHPKELTTLTTAVLRLLFSKVYRRFNTFNNKEHAARFAAAHYTTSLLHITPPPLPDWEEEEEEKDAEEREGSGGSEAGGGWPREEGVWGGRADTGGGDNPVILIEMIGMGIIFW